MENCVILGNGFCVKQSIKQMLMERIEVDNEQLEYILSEYSKINLIYSELCDEIGGRELERIVNPGVYAILSEEYVAAISTKHEINGKIYCIDICQKSYKEEKDTETIEVNVKLNDELNTFDEEFYDIKVKIKNCIKKFYKELYIIEDTQNEKICSELYLLIYNNENKFRSIINRYMVIRYGVDWFKDVIDKKYYDAASSMNNWYRLQRNAEFKDINCELYNLFIDDLINMLKDSQIEGIPSEDRNKYKTFVTNLKNGDLKSKLLDLNIDKESIWDKDFSMYISSEFISKWNEYKNMRNMVAHNKLICKEVRNNIINESVEISRELERISNELSRIYVDEEREYAQMILAQNREEIYIADAGGEALPDEDDVIEEIDNSQLYSNLIDEIKGKLDFISDARDDIEYKIEEIIRFYEEDDNSKEKSMIIYLYSMLEQVKVEENNFKRLCLEEVTNEHTLNMFLEDLLNQLDKFLQQIRKEEYNVTDSFCVGQLVHYTNIFGKVINITSYGTISPVLGGFDTISIKMEEDDEVVARGRIEKQYFDYSVSDYGAGMPEVEAYLNIDLDEVNSVILSDLDEEIRILDNINTNLYNIFSDVI